MAALVGATLGILAGVAVFMALNPKRHIPSKAVAALEPAVKPNPPPKPAVASVPKPKYDEEAFEHHRAGISALGEQDFRTAAREFALALKSSNPPPDTVELLGLAKSMEAEARATLDKAPSQPIKSVKARKVKALQNRSPKEPPSLPEPGRILITTTPPGLVVRVDGKIADMSPARLDLPAGLHEVALLDGERVLLQRRVRLQQGRVVSIQEDVRNLMAPPPSLPPPPAPPVEPPKTSPGTAAVITTPVSSPPPSPPPATPKPAAPPASKKFRRTAQTVLTRAAPKLRRCYLRQLVSAPELQGQIKVKIDIRPDGTVSAAQPESSTLDNAAAIDCILRTIRQLTFPPPKDGATSLVVPMSFKPDA